MYITPGHTWYHHIAQIWARKILEGSDMGWKALETIVMR